MVAHLLKLIATPVNSIAYGHHISLATFLGHHRPYLVEDMGSLYARGFHGGDIIGHGLGLGGILEPCLEHFYHHIGIFGDARSELSHVGVDG